MLRIEKLFIQGFKSFCDPTELLFDEEGITAVVGPNGCGKSNVADAISWVIGEQRAKALRGGKMEDVIFQGSRNRQPSGMAEVILTMMVRESFEIRGDAPITAPSSAPTPSNSDRDLNLSVPAETSELPTVHSEDSTPQISSSEPPSESVTPSESEDPEAVTVNSTESLPAGAAHNATPRKKKGAAAASLPRVFAEGERITIGRRLYRTGESEYEMNGRHCRLRDVQDLFAGTGLGAAHYAIIEQGRIGQVLSAKPLDRRALIEEAAGVSKFKMRQHSAEMKLEASKQNLSRVNDILAEIDRQQNSLRRQAGKARRFRKLQQETRDLMRAIFVVDYRETKKSIIGREGLIAEISVQEGVYATQRTKLEDEQVNLSQAAKTAESLLNETRQLAGSIDVELERLKQQTSFLQEQIQTLTLRNTQTEQERLSISDRRGFLEQESGRLKSELQTTELEINSENQSLTAAEEEHRIRSQQDLSAEAILEQKRKLAYESLTRLEQWRQLTRQFSESLEKSSMRLRGLTAEKERASEQSQNAINSHNEIQIELNDNESRHHSFSERLAEIKLSLNEQRRSREELRVLLAGHEREMTATIHRLQSLRELDQSRAYFSESVQAIVEEGRRSNAFQIHGTLADFVRVAPADESMVELALRDELQYLVVPTTDDAVQAIQFLNQHGGGRATFLVANNNLRKDLISPSEPDSSPRGNKTLASLLGLQPVVSAALETVFPDLLSAEIVDSLSDQVQIPSRPMLVSKQGERLVSGLLITGGSRNENSTGILAVKREIEELTNVLGAKREEVQTLSKSLQEVEEAVRLLEDELQHRDTDIRQLATHLAVLREQLIQCQRERERTATHIQVIEQETAQAVQEKEDFESRLVHARGEMEKAERDRISADQAAVSAQEELGELRHLAEERAAILSRRRADFAARTERRRGYINDLRRLENEIQTLNNRLGRLDFEDVEIGESLALARQNFELAKDRLAELNLQRETISIQFEERSLQLSNSREQYELTEQLLRDVRESSAVIREQRAQLEIDLAKLTANLEYLLQACHSELGEDLVSVSERLENTPAPPLPVQDQGRSEFLESVKQENDEESELSDSTNDIRFWHIPQDFDLALAKTRLAEVTERIDSLGPINMMALEELAEIEERQNFLMTQKLDLESAISDTQAAINEIRRRSKEQFIEAFNKINENFKQMFQELFGGGTGEMRLIDQNDLLESGIEIIAQPPGKRLQNVLLLSGGEKAMAALSLIMAIFRFRPSPFCLLDEVDAPLDEMNITRFSDKVLQMSGQTQFLIITHSKRTMEAARTLYGVTMEDPGISKLISVKLT